MERDGGIMRIDRRALLVGGIASLVAAPALAQRRSGGVGWYDRAIIIDALGGVGDPYSPDDQLRYSDRGWAETAATGVTVVRDTVFPVGNVSDPWSEYQKSVEAKHNIINANPDHMLLIRSAADILKAKREKRFGVLLGTQDTSMVGPELDRLAQMKKDGVMTVQLTYNKHPLYGFSLDKRAGQTNGEGQSAFGGRWYAVSANGTAVHKPPAVTTTTNTTTSSCLYPPC